MEKQMEKQAEKQTDKVHKTDTEWRQQLSDEEYQVTRKKGGRLNRPDAERAGKGVVAAGREPDPTHCAVQRNGMQ